jgi:tetratricopeptide (TPR) repeat protein
MMGLRSLALFVSIGLGVGLAGMPLQAAPGMGEGFALDLMSQATPKPITANDFFYSGVKKGEQEDWQGAIADFSDALRLNPNLIEAYNNRGTAYSIIGQNEKAIVDYNEAIRLKPTDPEAYYNRGVTYREIKDYPKAIADFSQSIRLSPKDAVSYFNRGVIFQQLGDKPKAIADFKQAAELFEKQGKKEEAKDIRAIIQQLQY